ncbi:MAG: lamin tail domain-containing protein, partial [Planctomycetales bacterium]|nr:lamin tail domain-containing protein [Planctomycetales bacterium]
EMLRYYLLASDSQLNETREPRVTDTTGTDQSPEYFGTVVSDPTTTSDLPIFHWFAPSLPAGHTRTGTRASVYFNGEFYDNVFARQRGQATNAFSQKFDFNSDHLFYVNDTVGRVEEINMNAQGTDPTYVRQTLAFEAWRDVGVPASESYLWRMEGNGNFDRVGVYIEQVDDLFLERNDLDPEGALYKFVQRATLAPVFSDTTTGIEKKTRLDEDFADIQAVVDGLNSPTQAERNQYVFDNFNVPEIINYLAIRAIIQDADDIRKNFYFYRDTNGTGEWSIYPWDNDFTFGIRGDGGPNLDHPFFGEQEHLKLNANQWNVMLDVMFDLPATQEMYLRRLRTLMDEKLKPPGTPQEQLVYENRISEIFAQAAADLARHGVTQATINSIAPFFPEQRNDFYVTHSVDNSGGPGIVSTLVPEFATGARWFVPNNDSVTDWTGIANPANIASWGTGQTGIGYESSGSDYVGLINTTVDPKFGNSQGPLVSCSNCTSTYVRIPFAISDQAALERIAENGLTLRMKFDDGFVAYINGVEIARSNVGGSPGTPVPYNTPATNHPDASAAVFENFNADAFVNNLVVGNNILAIQGVNTGTSSSDMLILPELVEGAPAANDVAGIPHAQVGYPALAFGAFEQNPVSGNQDEEYIELTNPNNTSVDISGWHITGGVEFTFAPGTVLNANSTMYLSPDVTAFRARSSGPSGGQGLFVQGAYQGHLSNFGETVNLETPDGSIMDSFVTNVMPSDVQQYLRISEVNYNPLGTEDNTEFLEFTNTSDVTTLDLSGVTITDGPSDPFVFAAGTTLAPGGYVVVVNDVVAFAAAYPSVPQAQIAGPFAGQLSNGGERLKVNDADGSTVIDFVYDDQGAWPESADGAGASLELLNASATPTSQMEKPYRWSGSVPIGGTPGEAPVASIGVVINEVLSNPESPSRQRDAIELLNTTGSAIDLSGWFLSDSSDDLLKFEIPGGTVLGPGEYIAFDERDFNPTPANPAPTHFGLSGTGGDDVWLSMATGSVATAIVDDVHFGAASPGVAWGRVPNGTGSLAPMSRTSVGCTNGNVRAGSLVISELNYHPSAPSAAALAQDPLIDRDDLEFVEIYNASLTTVALDDWRLRGGVDFEFASGVTLAAGETLVVLSFNPNNAANATRVAAFRAHYGIGESVVLAGGWSGQLSDSYELVRLESPGTPPVDDPLTIPRITADAVSYDDLAPWPVAADGEGSSLTRTAPSAFGFVASGWTAQTPSPGAVSFGQIGGEVTGDGAVSVGDIDVLLDMVRRGDALAYADVNGDLVVDSDDVRSLLSQSFETLLGDANLDGAVDGVDFGTWNTHRFQSCGTWSTGDFNGDGVTDVSDFNIWNAHKFVAVAGGTADLAFVPRAALDRRAVVP